MLRFASLAVLAVSILFIPSVRAGDSPLKIEGAWIIAVPPSSSATAAFMVLKNDSAQVLKIVSVSSPIAGSAEPMLGTEKGGAGAAMHGMETVDALEIPAYGSRTLKPGGDHLMLMDLKSHPKVGDQVEVTLRMEPGGEVRKLSVPVALAEPKDACCP